MTLVIDPKVALLKGVDPVQFGLFKKRLRPFFLLCVGHDAHLAGESPVTGICRQV